MRTSPKESDTQKAVIDLLTAEHIFAFRINTAKVRMEGRDGKVRYFDVHSLGPGCADIRADLVVRSKCTAPSCLVENLLVVPVWIECKAGDGKQKPAQKNFQKWVESHGHIYLLVDSIDEFRDWLEKMRGRKSNARGAS